MWVAEKRPFVILKLAVTLDGRVAVPGTRWVTGEEARAARARAACAGRRGRRRHGDGARRTIRSSTARDVDVAKQPRRLAFGRGPLPDGSELELRTGRLEDELATLAAEGVQSLLLEGGPKLAESFLRAGLVDKVLLFVAPQIAGSGPLVRSRTTRADGVAAFRSRASR